MIICKVVNHTTGAETFVNLSIYMRVSDYEELQKILSECNCSIEMFEFKINC